MPDSTAHQFGAPDGRRDDANGAADSRVHRRRSTVNEISDARVLADYGSMDVGWRRMGYREPAEAPFVLDLPPRHDGKRDRMLAALAELRTMRQEPLAARGGRPFPPVADDLAELCAQRGGEPG